jgi:hypothetical protein
MGNQRQSTLTLVINKRGLRIMSRNAAVVLIYRRHKLLDLNYFNRLLSKFV